MPAKNAARNEVEGGSNTRTVKVQTKNAARNNGAGFLLGCFFSSNTRTVKVQMDVTYPQGKFKSPQGKIKI